MEISADSVGPRTMPAIEDELVTGRVASDQHFVSGRSQVRRSGAMLRSTEDLSGVAG